MIAYNTKEARAAFAALADILDKTAKVELADDKPLDLSSENLGEMLAEIINADPDANAIRQLLEKVCTLAHDARDTETENDLKRRHAQLIEAYKAIGQSEEDERTSAAAKYSTNLRSHAAYIRAIGQVIGRESNSTDKAQQDIRRQLDRIEAKADEVKASVGEDLQAKVNETQTAANATLKITKTIPQVKDQIVGAVEAGADKTTRAVGGASVRIQNLKEAIERKDGDLEDVKQLQRDTLAAVGQLITGKPNNGTQGQIPSPRDYHVTTTELADTLTRLNAGRGKRTIELWERYLKTDGHEGTKPPDGYNLYTRLTLNAASAWAATFAANEKKKLTTKIAFDDRFHQRPK